MNFVLTQILSEDEPGLTDHMNVGCSYFDTVRIIQSSSTQNPTQACSVKLTQRDDRHCE